MACLSCFCLFAMCILCMCLCMLRCVWVHMWVQIHPCGIQILILSVLLSQFPDLNPELNNLASLRRQLDTRFPCLCLLHLRVIDLQIAPWDPNCGPQVYMESTLPISPSPQPKYTWYFVAQNQVFIFVQRTAYQLSHLPVPCYVVSLLPWILLESLIWWRFFLFWGKKHLWFWPFLQFKIQLLSHVLQSPQSDGFICVYNSGADLPWSNICLISRIIITSSHPHMIHLLWMRQLRIKE